MLWQNPLDFHHSSISSVSFFKITTGNGNVFGHSTVSWTVGINAAVLLLPQWMLFFSFDRRSWDTEGLHVSTSDFFFYRKLRRKLPCGRTTQLRNEPVSALTCLPFVFFLFLRYIRMLPDCQRLVNNMKIMTRENIYLCAKHAVTYRITCTFHTICNACLACVINPSGRSVTLTIV